MTTRSGLPLSALLSQVLVAFTIEFDNQFEHSIAGSPPRPWLVSLAMWSNCMRFVGDEGVNVGELEHLARTKTNLNGMERWGYIVIDPNKTKAKRLIRATPKGRKAQAVWRPLFGVIEKRWRERFGEREIDRLRESLAPLINQLDVELPDCLPILGYGLFSAGPVHGQRVPAECDDSLTLPALLSKVLLAFALEFERDSELSLAICANLLRVLDENGVRVRDLPLLSGVSKEAISMAMGILLKRRLVVVETSGRTKVVRLTPAGQEAQDAYFRRLTVLEKRWDARFGRGAIRVLRERLEPLVHMPQPYPDGWRASVRKPDTLPHYPMVLHRGGFPDGS